ncbi:MAG: hypothetical protein AAGA96_14720 [Verrucomicrobiota bacterium]
MRSSSSFITKIRSVLRPGWRQECPNLWLSLLQISVSLTFLARGWLTWRWDSPIRGLIWHEDWWSGWLETRFDLPWSAFAKASDFYINAGLTILGVTLMLLALVPWLITRRRFRSLRWLLWLGTALLALDSFARWVDKNFDLGMGIEHALQIFAPAILFFIVSSRDRARIASWLLGIGSAFTFVGHGLYAIGFHPVPLSYQTMTMKLLRVENETAIRFLVGAGLLDFLAALALLFRPVRVIGLLYMVGWGFLTAMARIGSHLGMAQPLYGLDPWIAETLVRTTHWMLPLLLLGLLRTKSAEAVSAVTHQEP